MFGMEDILANQQQIHTAIEQLYSNFKKDGADRKTSDYIKRRLDTLDKYWQEFQNNHSSLCNIEYAKTHSYITTNQFELVKEKYINIKAALCNYQSREDRTTTPVIKPATPLGMPGTSRQPSPQVPLLQAQGTSSKTDEMLRKQSSNFKAFQHTISNITLESVTEKWEFDHILRSLQSRWSIIDTLHWELDSELGGRSPDYEARFFEEESKYNEIIKAINRKMWSASHREHSTPQVEIPSFSGSYHQWSSFKDLFNETIHGNPTLSNAQKMQFLKSKVKGEAERLIQHLPITSDNYPICWDILSHRYNNKRLIFRSHIDILLNIPTISHTSINHIKRIHDTTSETLNAIKTLGVEVESWGPLLVHLLSQKLDTETHNDYVASVKEPRELPNLQEFLRFLESKFTSLESSRKKPEIPTKIMPINNYMPQHFNKNRNFNKQAFPAHGSVIAQQPTKSSKTIFFYKCGVCRTNQHCLYYCRKFLNMSPAVPRQTVSKLNVCENCLYSHNGKACISERRCTECNGWHNTILHAAFDISQSGQSTNNPSTSKVANNASRQKPETPEHLRSNSHVSLQCDIPEILLATAMLKVQAKDGTYVNMRALIDQGSQTSLITENAAQLLGHARLRCQGVISGVGIKESSCKGAISIKCKANNSEFEFGTEVYIMKQLIKNLPNYSFSRPSWTYLENIALADPEFNISRPVDILLGADIYSLIILEGICRVGDNIPISQNTRLGWILTGNVKTLQCNVVINSLAEIQNFWEIEDIGEESSTSSENQKYLDYYQSTTTRRQDGRYEVRLPMTTDFSEKIGESKFKAVAQFRSLEHKFSKDEHINKQYKLFINEYRLLGHMIPVTSNMKPEYFNTHHCVQSDDTINSKFRVVFNASSKTSSGLSLNDVMGCGPNLQQDLQSLIIKWRQYQYAFTADIEKMFRQIWIHPEDQKLLKIIWRDSTSEPIKQYQLTTVTYGTKAAPFLAMMTLKQLAHDEKSNYQNSEAIAVLENNFYMDDLIHGCHSIEAARKLQMELINLLSSGGFHLRKWKSNINELLLNRETYPSDGNNFNFKLSQQTKTLGLGWDPQEDNFTFKSTLEPAGLTNKVTKRRLLSDISKLFDPLGWLSPLSTTLKIIFQQVWAANIKWDEPVPNNIYSKWVKIREDLINIQHIKLPRWMFTHEHDTIELHGFSDASLKAYACVIYCRINNGTRSSVVLVVGKTRLVPTSKSVTLPRLELCGALLLSKLINKVKQCLQGHTLKIYGWVDSTAVLGWLNGDPARWKTFVANRVQEITAILPPNSWRYVKSEENPADCASRGLTATQLKEFKLWWQGPSWLSNYKENDEKLIYSTNEELKVSKVVNLVTQEPDHSIIQNILLKYSSFNELVRVLAWINRFINNISKKKQNTTTCLSVNELKQSTLLIIKQTQHSAFSQDLVDLQNKNKISNKSKLRDLNPFIDENKILRVGGRLRHANLDPEMKNPIIIPYRSRLSELLIDQAHELTFHGGARLTSALLRHKYWVIGGNRTTKQRLRQCVKCRRMNPSKHHQLMGDLPAARVNPSRPFSHVAVDYTGHVFIKANAGRGIKTTKGYVAVFTCLATKAVHLELVSDLTSTAFMSALRRMSARRGTPGHIYSDNGTNFVGANKVLQQEYEELLNTLDSEFHSDLSEMGISWHFNAPSWPSANGLCEAAVKSLKFHLRRVVGEQKLTYEELSTILAQLEACLNSRPLCPLTEDPEDLNYLTPSHFLSSGPILSIYETERDMRTRWHLTQQIFQDIWRRWQQEYLTNMTARSKWQQSQTNIKCEDVVIINDGNLPAGKWALGRVVELHPGNDGYVRVVTLKTKNGFIKRPLVKLSLLPINQD